MSCRFTELAADVVARDALIKKLEGAAAEGSEAAASMQAKIDELEKQHAADREMCEEAQRLYEAAINEVVAVKAGAEEKLKQAQASAQAAAAAAAAGPNPAQAAMSAVSAAKLVEAEKLLEELKDNAQKQQAEISQQKAEIDGLRGRDAISSQKVEVAMQEKEAAAKERDILKATVAVLRTQIELTKHEARLRADADKTGQPSVEGIPGAPTSKACVVQ